jgi:hypothetical protein
MLKESTDRTSAHYGDYKKVPRDALPEPEPEPEAEPEPAPAPGGYG